MLKQLRSKKIMKRILQVTLFLIIPSFVFFYGWSQKANTRSPGFYFARVKSPGIGRWSNITEGELRFAKSERSWKRQRVRKPWRHHRSSREIST